MNPPKLKGLSQSLASALARGIEERSTNVARTSIPKRDPLYWWFAQRRLRALLERERLLTGHDDPAHQMRRISITLAGFDCPESDDIEAVRRQYEGDVRPALGSVKGSYFTWGILVFVSACMGVFGYYRATHHPFDPHSMRAVALLEENLSNWTAATEAEAGVFAQRLRTPEAQRLLGADVTQALSVMLDKGAALAEVEPEELKVKGREFTQTQGAVDGALARMGLPVFVDASLLSTPSGAAPLILTYYIEQDEAFDYRGHSLRAISAWRMDPLRIRMPALGYVREGNPVAIISYDLIEAVLVLYLLPSLADKEPAFVFDEATRGDGDPRVFEIENRLGNVLRRHFDALHLDSDTRRLGDLLAQRRNLIAKWRRAITGFRISAPERLIPERDLGAKLETYISRTEAIHWGEISDGLSEARIVMAFERRRDELAAAIKRHELQHLMDQKDGLAAIPVVLARRLRVDASTEPEPYSLFGAARSELSAYMAQLADGPSPRLSLVQMATAVFDRNLRGQPHHFAVLAIFDGLMKSLRLTEDHPNYEEAVVRVIESEPAAVRDTARNLYEEWFGRTLMSATRTKRLEREHWHH